jgi:hypothetical protein
MPPSLRHTFDSFAALPTAVAGSRQGAIKLASTVGHRARAAVAGGAAAAVGNGLAMVRLVRCRISADRAVVLVISHVSSTTPSNFLVLAPPIEQCPLYPLCLRAAATSPRDCVWMLGDGLRLTTGCA